MANLTPAQERALEILNRDGVVFAYSGVSCTTAQVLLRAGYGTWKASLVTRRGPCGGSDTYLDWSLTK